MLKLVLGRMVENMLIFYTFVFPPRVMYSYNVVIMFKLFYIFLNFGMLVICIKKILRHSCIRIVFMLLFCIISCFCCVLFFIFLFRVVYLSYMILLNLVVTSSQDKFLINCSYDFVS